MIKPRVKVQIKGSHVEHIKKVLEASRGAYVSIGVHEGAGEYDTGESVVDVALWNEFGTQHAPQRSFLRSTAYEQQDNINAWRQEAIKKMLEEGWSVQKALSLIGVRLMIAVQNKIKSKVPPPNAPSTQARKAAAGVAPDRTLIETGLLLRSISYRVVLPE